MEKSIDFIFRFSVIILLWSCKNENQDTFHFSNHKIVRDSFIDRFSAHFTTQMNRCHCPGAAVTVVQDSTVRWIQSYGVKSTLTNMPIDSHTLFRLASVSKNFASIITQIMVDRHALRWEDKVTQYLPDFELNPIENTTLLTINNIISHTSGLSYHSYTNLVESNTPITSIYPLFKNIHCKVLPGEEYAYQNACYAMIEPILQKATGRSYAELLKEILIDSLHMPDICYTYSSMLNRDDVALPHRPDSGDHYVPTTVSDKYYNTISAGGINASITDMSIWLKLLLGNDPKLIPKDTLDSFFKPLIRTTTDRRYYNYWPGVTDSYYAKGMRILNYGDHYKYYHAGYANDYRAEIAIDPSHHIGIVVLFNSTCEWSEYVIPDFFSMYDEWMAGCR